MGRIPEGGTIVAADGVAIRIGRSMIDGNLHISLEMQTYRRCFLHWGLTTTHRGAWQVPPSVYWPEQSQAIGHGAMQTEFLTHNGSGRIEFKLPGHSEYAFLEFALYYPVDRRWDNNAGRNYILDLSLNQDSVPSALPEEQLRDELQNAEVLFENNFNVASRERLAAAVIRVEGGYRALLLTNVPGPLVLHWGVADGAFHEWKLPPPVLHPPGTMIVEGRAAESRFDDRQGLRRLQLDFREEDAPRFVTFVLRRPDTGQWLKYGAADFHLPITPSQVDNAWLSRPDLTGIANEIIEKEMSSGSWTLMHRFNLCYDLLDKVEHNTDGLALLFVWLRFSVLRQLDWQRNYNTKPRELGHSLDRLTQKLADLSVLVPTEREILRLIMGTLGRGADAQRVRDEVLNIMHRHHIKEVSGHFMEEWHQKLHNNTTYDDVVICEAYIEFLKSDGSLSRFYEALGKGGVTKQRLEHFERPIKSHPDFIPYLKEPLIRDFEHFLGILREVHSGTDLGASIKIARNLLDAELNSLMDFIWSGRDVHGPRAVEIVAKVTEARRRLSSRLAGHEGGRRDLFLLDIALENFLRLVVERDLHLQYEAGSLVDLIGMVLENLNFSTTDQEFTVNLNQWLRLRRMSHQGREWALLVKSVLDRLRRALGGFVTRYHRLLQPKAEHLGGAFHAEGWTIDLFSEDVIRGRTEFVLSALIEKLDPLIRKIAHLGDWQIISPGQGKGFVRKVASLKSIQGAPTQEPLVIITDTVVGNEEIPPGVTALFTSVTADIVSHLAIRARNARVLFATCYNAALLDQLKSMDGHYVSVTMDTKGDVTVREVEPGKGFEEKGGPHVRIKIQKPHFTTFAVSQDGFNARNVGGKSNNLRQLHNKLPEWINFPVSVALPFMVFEKVLSDRINSTIGGKYEELVGRIENVDDEEKARVLALIRQLIQGLGAPDELMSSLRTVMKDEGLPQPIDWASAWRCITTVWASKWNDRAYWSRSAMGIQQENLVMAVLIQQVIEAEYAFVIHTVNPLTGDKGEVYGEVVPGLGEALVGNYPGRALSFVCKKGSRNPLVVGFPSKSEALYGTGLIFRSDSNGEDLSQYAGAGLYESVMLPIPRKVSLDYSNEPLVWNEEFQRDLLQFIGFIGEAIEQVAGLPQDIEGAYSNGRYYVVQTRPQVGSVNG